jgi:hypothetical protein
MIDNSRGRLDAVRLPCHISTDVSLRGGRNTAETNTAGYQ